MIPQAAHRGDMRYSKFGSVSFHQPYLSMLEIDTLQEQ